LFQEGGSEGSRRAVAVVAEIFEEGSEQEEAVGVVGE